MGNVSAALREAFATEEWHQLEEKYLKGGVSVEESNRQQYALIRTHIGELQEIVLQTTEVRAGFKEFVEYCRGNDIGFAIVSSGLDLYIEPVLKELGLLDVERHSGQAHVTPEGILVDYIDPSGVNVAAGFKLSWLRELKKRGRPIVYLGDGLSDIEAAREADYVMARGSLLEHFRANALPYFSFETFYDVKGYVEELRGR